MTQNEIRRKILSNERLRSIMMEASRYERVRSKRNQQSDHTGKYPLEAEHSFAS
jgi:hypothetical protein